MSRFPICFSLSRVLFLKVLRLISLNFSSSLCMILFRIVWLIFLRIRLLFEIVARVWRNCCSSSYDSDSSRHCCLFCFFVTTFSTLSPRGHVSSTSAATYLSSPLPSVFQTSRVSKGPRRVPERWSLVRHLSTLKSSLSRPKSLPGPAILQTTLLLRSCWRPFLFLFRE